MDGLIITLTGNYNYGNIIQRYALKHVLEQNGKTFDTTHIQPRSDDKTSVYLENTRGFVRKYVGGEDFDTSKLQGYRNYIVGSDQVWRDWSGGNWTQLSPYFLEFVDNKSCPNFQTNRISYAASFGLDKVAMSANTQARVRPLLEKFSAISVREDSGQSILNNTWGLESTVVLDPTLLLKSSDYSRLIENSNSRTSRIKKLYYYILDGEEDIMDFIMRISHTMKLEKTGFVMSQRKRLKPVEKWLKGFRDAEFVITDSYHGMIFSILNNTNFVVVGNFNRGLSRFESLLGALGLGGRLVDMKALKHLKLSDLGSVDWDAVNKKVEQQRTSSLKWLLKSIK